MSKPALIFGLLVSALIHGALIYQPSEAERDQLARQLPAVAELLTWSEQVTAPPPAKQTRPSPREDAPSSEAVESPAPVQTPQVADVARPADIPDPVDQPEPIDPTEPEPADPMASRAQASQRETNTSPPPQMRDPQADPARRPGPELAPSDPVAQAEPSDEPDLPPLAEPSPLSDVAASTNRPGPDLADAIDVASTLPGEGDFAGSRHGQVQPSLHIDWGDRDHSLEVIRAGQMQLVVIDTDRPGQTAVQYRVHRDGSGWRVSPWWRESNMTYSSTVRVVHNVRAFAHVVRELDLPAHQKLAVLLPQHVDRMMRSAQLAAALSQDLDLTRVRRCAGRFNVQRDALAFDITAIQLRSEMP